MELSSAKLKAVSAVAREMGQVFFASLFIGPFVNGSINWPVIIAGAIFSLISWFLSVALIKE